MTFYEEIKGTTRENFSQVKRDIKEAALKGKKKQ